MLSNDQFTYYLDNVQGVHNQVIYCVKKHPVHFLSSIPSLGQIRFHSSMKGQMNRVGMYGWHFRRQLKV